MTFMSLTTDCRHRTASHERPILAAGPTAIKIPQIRTQTEMILSLGQFRRYPETHLFLSYWAH
jgi:hypothetical protein